MKNVKRTRNLQRIPIKVDKEIKIHNLYLKNLRDNLRGVIVKAVHDKLRLLRRKRRDYEESNKLNFSILNEDPHYGELSKTLQQLELFLKESICICFGCGCKDRDMLYIPSHNAWYCVECYDKNLIAPLPLTDVAIELRRKLNFEL